MVNVDPVVFLARSSVDPWTLVTAFRAGHDAASRQLGGEGSTSVGTGRDGVWRQTELRGRAARLWTGDRDSDPVVVPKRQLVDWAAARFDRAARAELCATHDRWLIAVRAENAIQNENPGKHRPTFTDAVRARWDAVQLQKQAADRAMHDLVRARLDDDADGEAVPWEQMPLFDVGTAR